MTISDKAQTASDAIFQFCNEIAMEIDAKAKNNSSNFKFDAKLGAGRGDKATAEFLTAVNAAVSCKFAPDVVVSEKPLYVKSNSKFDFYIPGEQTVIEVALSLRSPTTEFEKDILKVLIFNQKHSIEERIKKLIFIGKIGAVEKCKQGLRLDMIAWAKEIHCLEIEVKDIQHQRCTNT
jgi:hypothetical protein